MKTDFKRYNATTNITLENSMAFLRKVAFSVSAFILITSLTGALVISHKLSELLEWFVVLVFSFISGNVISYYIKKFLEKELDFDDFYYLKKAVIIAGRDVILWLVLPFFLFLISITNITYDLDLYIISRIPTLVAENPFYWTFFCGILIFSYRINHIKINLIKLQKEYNDKIKI